MKITNIFLLLTLSMVLTGCDNNVDKVKNSIFNEIDDSVKIGDAISNRVLCESVSWNEITDPQKRNVVKYTCNLKNDNFNKIITDHINRIKEEKIKKSTANEAVTLESLNKSIALVSELHASHALDNYFHDSNALIKKLNISQHDTENLQSDLINYIYDDYYIYEIKIKYGNNEILNAIEKDRSEIFNVFKKHDFQPNLSNRSISYSSIDYDIYRYLFAFFTGEKYWSSEELLNGYKEMKGSIEGKIKEKINIINNETQKTFQKEKINNIEQNIYFSVLNDNVSIRMCEFIVNGVKINLSDVNINTMACVSMAYNYEFNESYKLIMSRYLNMIE